ncbi:hypothetical protein SAMN02910368_01862 [Lachnospiraceae bacterium G11]|nr:hypothetical protein SAMN02910368_01862 [Lachnospiraceae bacterium G11]
MNKTDICSLINKIFANRQGIIRATIIALGLFAVSVIWPMGKFTADYKSVGTWDEVRFIGPGTEDNVIRQEFSPTFDNLTSVSVYIVNEPDSFDTLETFFRVYSLDGTVLAESKVNLADYEVPGLVTFPLEVSLEPGTVYFYTVGGVDGEVFVALTSEEAGNAEAGAFYYNNVHSGGTNVVAEFDYVRPWGLKRIITADLVIALITFALYLLASILLNRMEETQVLKTEKVTKYVLSGAAIIAAISAVVGIDVFQLFEHDALNNGILTASILLVSAFLIFYIFKASSYTEKLEARDNIDKLGKIVSEMLLAGALIMCCLYQNSGSDYEHGLWIRRAAVFFALFLYSLGKAKQIWNILAVVWSVASVFIGRYYISAHSDHIEHINTATSTAWLFWAAGLLVVGLVYRIIDKDYRKLKTISLPIAVPAVVFWILTSIFSYGREWPIQLLLAFVLAFLFMYMSERRKDILEMVCNAWLIAFFAAMLFCIYRRPYQYYMMTRYGGIFITVTVTATYYLIATAATLTKVLIAYRKNDTKSLLFSYAMFGAVSTYLFFTASRTGIVAYGVELLIALIIFVWQKKKDIVKSNVIKLILSTVAALIVSYVAFFGIARMLPAVIRNPFYYNYESYCQFIHPDSPLDGGERWGERYANIEISLETLFGRMFNSDDELTGFLPSLSLKAKAAESTSIENYANGRLDIFRTYIKNLTIKGHESMGCEDENGNVIIHAHNAYIQTAYDFGIILGAAFVLLCLYMLFVSIYKTSLYAKERQYLPMILILIVGFIVAGMFEWTYHPMNPLGFAFLLSWVLLSEKEERIDV